MVKQHIASKIREALQKIGITESNIILDTPSNQSFGDYTTNIAMRLSGQLKKKPLDIANELKNLIQPDDIIERIDLLAPGFINFWLKKTILLENLNHVIQEKDKFGHSQSYKDKKVIIEYTDPNPFKEFHIGHLYSNTVGESLVRLHKALGADVRPVCYQGDVGMHVAKSIWGMQKLMKEEQLNLDAFNEKYKTTKDKAKFMGRSYALGATAFEEDAAAKKVITDLNKKIYAHDHDIEEIYQLGRQWSLDYFELIYKRLGTHFEHYFFESQVGERGLTYVKDNLKNGIFKESDGAIVFEGEKYGLHTRVFINSLGLPTYEAKDLGLAPTKYEWFPYDLSIIVTGNEVDSYFQVVLKALELINADLAKKSKHISHGMVRLPEGKMSSRTGKVVTGEWLLDTAKQKALQIIKETTKSELTADSEDIAEKVAVAAIKYALLKNNIGKNVEFDFDESVSFEGNSGPYLQYTYVRCKSVLSKAESERTFAKPDSLSSEELELLRALEKYSNTVESAAKMLAPNLICNYLFNLAQLFNLFYQKHQILKAESVGIKNFRLQLTSAVAQTLQNGLHLLGIETVEKM